MKNKILITIAILFSIPAIALAQNTTTSKTSNNKWKKESWIPKSSTYIFSGREDTIPVTMLISEKFGTDDKITIDDTTIFYVQSAYQTRGFMVIPEHAPGFFLFENKHTRVETYFIVWDYIPYNYHFPISSRLNK
jgi:hypothetical protein